MIWLCHSTWLLSTLSVGLPASASADAPSVPSVFAAREGLAMQKAIVAAPANSAGLAKFEQVKAYPNRVEIDFVRLIGGRPRQSKLITVKPRYIALHRAIPRLSVGAPSPDNDVAG